MNTEPFVEQDCKITHEGKEFESGGAYILPCTDGKLRGVVYVNTEKHIVTDWHGNFIAKIKYSSSYQGNFCRMRSISFDWNGHHFTGRYCPDWAECCKVHSTK